MQGDPYFRSDSTPGLGGPGTVQGGSSSAELVLFDVCPLKELLNFCLLPP